MEIIEDEKSAIAAYKTYSRKYFPWVEKLSDFVVMNFDPNAYKKDTTFEGLKKYLDELDLYLGRLSKSADLRQYHFERWVKDRYVEEKGHKYWREGLNKIVEDGKEKYSYWSEIYQQMFEKIISDFEKRPDTLSHLDLCTVNEDFEHSKEQISGKKKVNSIIYYRRPRISDSQKKRLASARKKQKTERDAQDLASIKNITKTNMKEYHEKYNRIDMKCEELIENWDNLKNYLKRIKYDDSRKRDVFIDAIENGEKFYNLLLLFMNDFNKIKSDNEDPNLLDIAIKFNLFISILSSDLKIIELIYLHMGNIYIFDEIVFHPFSESEITYVNIALCFVCGMFNLCHGFFKEFEAKFNRLHEGENKGKIIQYMKHSCYAYVLYPYFKEAFLNKINGNKKFAISKVKGKSVIYKGKIYGGLNGINPKIFLGGKYLTSSFKTKF